MKWREKSHLLKLGLTISNVHSKFSLGWTPNILLSRNTLSTVYLFICIMCGFCAKYRANNNLRSYGALMIFPERVIKHTVAVSVISMLLLGVRNGALKNVPPCKRNVFLALSAIFSINACCQAVFVRDETLNVISSAVETFWK